MLMVEHRLRVFKNRGRYFGHKREKVTGVWRKMCNGELCVLYSSPKAE